MSKAVRIILKTSFPCGCGGSSLLPGLFSSCAEWGLFSSCGVRASRFGGFFGCRAPGHADFSSCGPALQSADSVAVARGLICPWVCGIFPDQD